MKILTTNLNNIANIGQSTFSMIVESLFSQTKAGQQSDLKTERAFNFLNLNDASENTNWDGMCVSLPESEKEKNNKFRKISRQVVR